MMRGPYGNGFNWPEYKNMDLVVIAGGTGLSPVRALIFHFAEHLGELKFLTIVAGFKSKNY